MYPFLLNFNKWQFLYFQANLGVWNVMETQDYDDDDLWFYSFFNILTPNNMLNKLRCHTHL